MNKLKTYLANISLRELIYPGIILVAAIMMLTAFMYSSRFLSGEINRALVVKTTGSAQTIDIVRYAIIARHIGLPEIGTATGEDGALDTLSDVSEDQASTTEREIIQTE